MSPDARRETMADALLELQDRCMVDGLSYAEELAALACAWLHERRRMGSAEPITVLAPEPDEGFDRSPGHRILAASQTERPEYPNPAPSAPAMPAPDPAAGVAPTNVRRHKVGPKPSPVTLRLRKLLAGTAEPFEVDLSKINYATLASRLYQISKASKTHRLSMRRTQSGTAAIGRLPR